MGPIKPIVSGKTRNVLKVLSIISSGIMNLWHLRQCLQNNSQLSQCLMDATHHKRHEKWLLPQKRTPWLRGMCQKASIQNKMQKKKNVCVGRESNPGQLLGRQLCSPLYHRRHVDVLSDLLSVINSFLHQMIFLKGLSGFFNPIHWWTLEGRRRNYAVHVLKV